MIPHIHTEDSNGYPVEIKNASEGFDNLLRGDSIFCRNTEYKLIGCRLYQVGVGEKGKLYPMDITLEEFLLLFKEAR